MHQSASPPLSGVAAGHPRPAACPTHLNPRAAWSPSVTTFSKRARIPSNIRIIQTSARTFSAAKNRQSQTPQENHLAAYSAAILNSIVIFIRSTLHAQTHPRDVQFHTPAICAQAKQTIKYQLDNDDTRSRGDSRAANLPGDYAPRAQNPIANTQSALRQCIRSENNSDKPRKFANYKDFIGHAAFASASKQTSCAKTPNPELSERESGTAYANATADAVFNCNSADATICSQHRRMFVRCSKSNDSLNHESGSTGCVTSVTLSYPELSRLFI